MKEAAAHKRQQHDLLIRRPSGPKSVGSYNVADTDMAKAKNGRPSDITNSQPKAQRKMSANSLREKKSEYEGNNDGEEQKERGVNAQIEQALQGDQQVVLSKLDEAYEYRKN